MIIYILRHEDRTQDCTFFSPLTENGIENSEKLVEILKKLKINKIYSSPFIRTLQTIYPYSKKYEHLINIDYGLAELQHPDLIPPNSYQVTLPQYLAIKFNVNDKYNSTIKPTEYNYPENNIDLSKRVKKLIKKIINNNHNSENVIILVTHQGVCNTMHKIISKNVDLKKDIKYPKGGLTKIFYKNKWVFDPINWEI